ncbi:hypothetical protein MU469_14245, partial [Staphylococcus aureus]|uniref:hypothetical protein n=1 Tax=Staphylococcus aureus TaxID=1280 RepID=UPI001FD52CB7
GKGHEVGNTVTVTFPDGKTATSKVDEKGNWTVDVPEGTELKAVSYTHLKKKKIIYEMLDNTVRHELSVTVP